MHRQTFGEGSARVLAGLLSLAMILLILAVREARAPVPRPPLPPSPPSPLLLKASEKPALLDRLSRRYADGDLTLEVIYASPLLPSDEAPGPVFRVVAIYRLSSAAPALPTDLGMYAQLRTSDGRVRENLLWQEEIRSHDRVLGYLCCLPDESSPFLTTRARWVELSLVGVASRPLRFRWPVGGRNSSWRGSVLSDKLRP